MKRRVTVHFGDVRVVVPCQDENTTVGDLAEAAILRYKKATGKVSPVYLVCFFEVFFSFFISLSCEEVLAAWWCLVRSLLFFSVFSTCISLNADGQAVAGLLSDCYA